MEVSGHALFPPPTSLGRQDGEGATSGGSSSQGRKPRLVGVIATVMKGVMSSGVKGATRVQCSTVVSREAKRDGKIQGQGYFENFSSVIW
ncbi:hypothetical protein TNCV_3709841 [Trichonephila clavipes]|nr:hypothetical protein TNCV_3709841 [Trichonephila clavipes]